MRLLRERFPELVLLWSALSFFVLLLELLLVGHTEEAQLVGILAAGLGVLASLLALGGGALRKAALLLLFFVGLAGLLGTFVHFEEGWEEAYEYEYEDEESRPPPLAPLGLTGTALLAALAALARREVTSG